MLYNIDELYVDGYHFLMRGWIAKPGLPSYKLKKCITLFSTENSQNIIPDTQIRKDVTSYINSINKSKYTDYDHSGFIIKILRQTLPNDYFNIRINVSGAGINEHTTLKQMIYI